MPLYEYAGKHPEIPPDGEGVARPGEVRKFGEEPGWGAWRELTAEETDAVTSPPEHEEPGWRRDPGAAGPVAGALGGPNQLTWDGGSGAGIQPRELAPGEVLASAPLPAGSPVTSAEPVSAADLGPGLDPADLKDSKGA